MPNTRGNNNTHSTFLDKWLNPLGSSPTPQAAPSWQKSLPSAVQRVLQYEPLRNDLMCKVARNFWTGASYATPYAEDTSTEKKLMSRYFGGGGGSYQLSPSEWNGLVRYYNNYVGNKKAPDGDHVTKIPSGYRRLFNSSGVGADPRFNGSLGTSTGFLDKNLNLVGVRDVFDFDNAPRGHDNNPAVQAGFDAFGRLVNFTQRDADTFCPGRSNPVAIRGGKIP
jgi:hypothetical protein